MSLNLNLSSIESEKCLAACFSLAAAFPVGAARAIRGLESFEHLDINARILTAVDVFPVPGPPAMMQIELRNAIRTAARRQSVSF